MLLHRLVASFAAWDRAFLSFFVVQPGDSFVIVACDGLWDELSNHEAVTRCANFLRLAEESERGGVAQVRRFRLCTAISTLHD
jgi:hypothetical protein